MGKGKPAHQKLTGSRWRNIKLKWQLRGPLKLPMLGPKLARLFPPDLIATLSIHSVPLAVAAPAGVARNLAIDIPQKRADASSPKLAAPFHL